MGISGMQTECDAGKQVTYEQQCELHISVYYYCYYHYFESRNL